jgi:hypothetical protein
MKPEDKVNGYNERHLAQLIRRSMISKVKPNGKAYSRKKDKNNLVSDK